MRAAPARSPAAALRLARRPFPPLARPASSLAPALPPPSPLRALLTDTSTALAHVDDLTRADSAWPRRLARAVETFDERTRRQQQQLAAAGRAGRATAAGAPLDKREITLYGPPLTGSDRLLLALLEDPLASDADAHSAAQRARVDEAVARAAGAKPADAGAAAVRIEYGAPSPAADSPSASSPSPAALLSTAPFLRSSPALALSYLAPSFPTSEALSTLLLAPSPVLILDSLRLFAPLTQPASPSPGSPSPPKPDPSVLQALLRHPSLKLIVNRLGPRGLPALASAGPTADEFKRLRDELAGLVGYEPDVLRRLAGKGRLTWVDGDLAREGFDAWKTSGLGSSSAAAATSASAVGEAGTAEADRRALQEFTDKVTGSNLAAVQFTLSTPAPSSSAAVSDADAVVPFLVDLALDSASFDLVAHDAHLTSYSSAAKALASNSAGLATQFLSKALAVPAGVGAIDGEERRVSEEVVKDVRAAVERVLEGFGWVGMVGKGRVDDVGVEVGETVRLGWGGEGERQLIFQTGVLSVLQQSLSSSLSRTLAHPPHPALHSPVLINDLPRPTPITPDLLLGPVQTRLGQLLAPAGRGPISVLQSRAQTAVRTTYVLSALSSTTAYGAWLAEVATPEGALAAAVLGAVAGARIGLARWDKAKRKFWLDFERVQGGLEEDLQKNTHAVISTALLARPRTAVEGIEALVGRRRAVLSARAAEVEGLRRRLGEWQALGRPE